MTLKRVGLFFSPIKHSTHTQDLWQLAVRYWPGRSAHISLMCPTSRPTLRLGHTGSRVPASSSDASVSRLLPPPPTQPPPLAPRCCCVSLCLLHPALRVSAEAHRGECLPRTGGASANPRCCLVCGHSPIRNQPSTIINTIFFCRIWYSHTHTHTHTQTMSPWILLTHTLKKKNS